MTEFKIVNVFLTVKRPEIAQLKSVDAIFCMEPLKMWQKYSEIVTLYIFTIDLMDCNS